MIRLPERLGLGEKGSPAPGDTNQPSIQRTFSIKAHVSDLGWQEPVYEGMTAGTTGRNLAIEALTISKPDLGYSGNIEYRAHVQNIGWQKLPALRGSLLLLRPLK